MDEQKTPTTLGNTCYCRCSKQFIYQKKNLYIVRGEIALLKSFAPNFNLPPTLERKGWKRVSEAFKV